MTTPTPEQRCVREMEMLKMIPWWFGKTGYHRETWENDGFFFVSCILNENVFEIPVKRGLGAKERAELVRETMKKKGIPAHYRNYYTSITKDSIRIRINDVSHGVPITELNE